MIRVIKETENYRVIENTARPGQIKLQQNCGCWRTYGEYKRTSAAVKKMEKLEASRMK